MIESILVPVLYQEEILAVILLVSFTKVERTQELTGEFVDYVGRMIRGGLSYQRVSALASFLTAFRTTNFLPC